MWDALLDLLGRLPLGGLEALLVPLSAGFLAQLFRYSLDRRRERRDKQRLESRLELDAYTPTALKREALDLALYVPPDCQDNDPAAGTPAMGRRPLFEEMDRLLGPRPKARCFFLLADSGMGKTSFLLKYYLYHRAQRTLTHAGTFDVVVIPLGDPNADALINAIPLRDRTNTALFLDALDEDPAAIKDYATRMATLMRLPQEFYAVVISCRTQFLPAERPLPKEVTVAPPVGPTGLGELPGLEARRLYLSSFSAQQVERYLGVRFPWARHPVLRRRALRTAARFPDLITRPFLLTHIQDLAAEAEPPKHTFEVYQVIVHQWLERERRKGRLTTRKEDLQAFSQDLAGTLFCRPDHRMPTQQLHAVTRKHSVRLDPHDVRERSLLHYDAEGNWKFAHRSILEYLLVKDCSLAKIPPDWIGPDWTDQMRTFAREMLLAGICRGLPGADLRGMDLRGVSFRRMVLTGALLHGAELGGADVADTDLTPVRGLTLAQAITLKPDDRTRWPALTLYHSERIWACAVSPKGDFIVSGSADGTLKVWDVGSRTERFSLTGHHDSVWACAVSPKSDFIVSASDDKTLKLWDVRDGTESFTLTGHHALVRACAVGPDGSFIVSASDDKTLKLWDVLSRTERFSLTGHDASVRACAVSPDGSFIVSGSADGMLKVWDVLSRTERFSLTGHHALVRACAVSPHGNFIVSASHDKTLKVWDSRTGRKRLTLRGHAGSVMACAVSPKSDFIVSASQDCTLKVWDARSGTERFSLTGHAGTVFACAVSPDGSFIVSGSQDQTTRIWFPPGSEAVRALGRLH